MNKQVKYGLLVNTLYEGQTIPVDPRCYGFILINKGDCLVTVNGIKLKPYPPGHPELSGESFSFVDPCRSFYNRDFTVIFDAGAAPQLQLIQVYDASN